MNLMPGLLMYTDLKAFRSDREPRTKEILALKHPYAVRLALVSTVVLLAAGVAWSKPKPKPITAKSQILFGVEMAELELWSEALFRFQQAERIGGGGAAVYNNMAVAYEALGVFDKAREYYLLALEADSKNANLRRNYSRFIEFYQSYQPGGEGEEEKAEKAGEKSSGEDSDPARGS